MRRFLLCWLALTAAVVAGLSLASRANMVQMPFSAGGGGTTPTQWGNTAGVDRDSTITVSTTTQANDTVVGAATGSNWGKARGTNVRPHLGTDANPKYHLEYIATTINTNGWIAAIADGADSLTEFCGQNVSGHAIGIQLAVTGPYIGVFYQGVAAGPANWAVTPANGDRIAVEADLNNKLLWFQDWTQKPGSSSQWSDATGTFTGNPGAGTGGIAFNAMWSVTSQGTAGIVPCWSGNLSSKAQLITKAANFSAPLSSGFTAWDPP
jgi:hypothetical protein